MSRILVDDVAAAIRAAIIKRHPDWVIQDEGGCWNFRVVCDDSRCGAVYVRDDSHRFARERSAVAKAVEISPAGEARATTLTKLDDFDNVARRVITRLEVGLASNLECAARREREWRERDEQRERERTLEAAHPQAFAAGARWSAGTLVLPEYLAAQALAAIEAVLSDGG